MLQARQREVFTTEHLAVQQVARDFLTEQVLPQLPEFRREHGLPSKFWLAAGERGLLGLRIPAAYGGTGTTDPLFGIAVTEELARVSAALSSCVGMHAAVCASYLVKYGSPEQQERWLPRMATGELICALAMTEPEGGSDIAALRTTAVRSGADWVLNGTKTFITNGGSAGLVIVAARTTPDAGAQGITLYGVCAKSPGFRRGRILEKLGQEEANTAELHFQDLRIPDSDRIGATDGGFGLLMGHLIGERMGAAAANTANADQILRETLAFVQERKAFGRPVGSFQANKFKLAELVTQISVTQAYVDECLRRYAAAELTAVDAAKAKWWSAQVQNDVIDDCLQMHGGYGYLTDSRVGRAWRDARVTKIWAGSNEIMKEIIGRDLGL